MGRIDYSLNSKLNSKSLQTPSRGFGRKPFMKKIESKNLFGISL
jgi:hypothetical protein